MLIRLCFPAVVKLHHVKRPKSGQISGVKPRCICHSLTKNRHVTEFASTSYYRRSESRRVTVQPVWRKCGVCRAAFSRAESFKQLKLKEDWPKARLNTCGPEVAGFRRQISMIMPTLFAKSRLNAFVFRVLSDIGDQAGKARARRPHSRFSGKGLRRIWF